MSVPPAVSRYIFARVFTLVIMVALVFGGCLLLLPYQVYLEYSREKTYQQNYGTAWEDHYKADLGFDAVERGHGKMILGAAGTPVIVILLVFIVRQARGKKSSGGGRRKRRRRRETTGVK